MPIALPHDPDAPLVIDGHRYWLVNGRLRPFVSGGSEGDDDGGDEGDEGGTDDGGTDDTGTEDDGAGGGDDDGLPDDPAELKKMLADKAAEAEKFKGLAKKHEGRSKANHAELEKLRKAGMPDTERQLEEAREAGKAEARSENAQRLAGAEIKAALTGVVKEPSAVVEDLNLAKFVTDDGEVDSEAVTALKTKYQQMGGKPKFSGDGDGGGRGGTEKKRAGSLDEAVNRRLDKTA